MTRTPSRLLTAFLLVATPLLAATPAQASCSKPILPFCASDGDLTDRYVSQAQCRNEVKGHLNDLERYRKCLQHQLDILGQDVERLRELIEGEAHHSQS